MCVCVFFCFFTIIFCNINIMLFTKLIGLSSKIYLIDNKLSGGIIVLNLLIASSYNVIYIWLVSGHIISSLTDVSRHLGSW